MNRLSIPLFILYSKIKYYGYPILRFLINLECLFTFWLVMLLYHIYQEYPRWKKACLIRIKDGDTIVYYLPQQEKKYLVGRLWGIDAFETAQKPWGSISKKKLSQVLKFDEDVSLDQCHNILIKNIKKDKYGRELVFLKNSSLEKISINEKMIQSGWALHYIGADWLGSEKTAWKKIQDYAQMTKKGIWKYPKKYWQRPSRFRKNILTQLEHHKGFDQKFSEPEQKLLNSRD